MLHWTAQRRLYSVLLAIVCGTVSPAVAKPRSPYAADIEFALESLEAKCKHFFKLKGIDWKKVSAEFRQRVRRVKSPQQHLVLLVQLLARLEDGHAIVRPLAKGKNVRPPAEWTRPTAGPGIFLCQVGKKLFIKNSWDAAARSGIKPGMEVVKLDGQVPAKWLAKRVLELRDRTGFSTDHQATFYAFHWGLSKPRGTRFRLEYRDLKRKKRRTSLPCLSNQVPSGPAFLPEELTRKKDIGYGTTKKGWGYIHIRRCPGNLPELMDEALTELGKVPGMILDFRGNSGGGFDHDALLGRFVPTGATLRFKKRYRSAGAQPYGGPVVVIVDATVRSAGETASGIFKEDGRAYMIGESPTAGMSASKETLELPSGLFALYFAVHSNKLRFNGGKGIEGIGVPPHEVVAYSPRDLAAGEDTLIRRAEALLSKFPQSKVPYNPARFGWRK